MFATLLHQVILIKGMNKTFRLFLLSIIVVIVTPVSAQYSFRSIDLRMGLSDNYVRTIVKDSQGFVWLGTLNGLSRYDGIPHSQL